MSRFIVHGAAGSGSVPVEAALTLLGLPYDVIETPTWEGDAERDKVARVNPMRQIPALITPPDAQGVGETLTESAAILIWLADRHRAPLALSPALDDPRRGQFLRWMAFVSASIYSLYWIRDVPARLAGDDADDQERILERTAERIAHNWRTMNEQVSPGRYILGDDLTVLDLYVAVVSRWRPLRPRFYREAPKLSQVVRRIDQMPELESFWRKRFPFHGDYTA